MTDDEYLDDLENRLSVMERELKIWREVMLFDAKKKFVAVHGGGRIGLGQALLLQVTLVVFSLLIARWLIEVFDMHPVTVVLTYLGAGLLAGHFGYELFFRRWRG